jgi:thiol-disulfide isomerase/thioredoxin
MREAILGLGLMMLAILLNVAAFASAAAAGACAAPPPELGAFQPASGARSLPAVPYVDADGREQPLNGLVGMGLVVNLWATWCPPCVEEMPALDRLAAQTTRTGVRVLALSADREGAAVVRRFFDVNGIRNLPVALDKTGRVARAAGIGGLPTTLLYDTAGHEIGRLTGVAPWDAPEVVAFLGACLAGRG